MEIIPYTERDKAAYSAFLLSHPLGSLFQSILWAEYQERAFGRKSILLLGWKEGKIVSSVLLLIHLLPYHKSYLYAPRGPLLSENGADNTLLFDAIAKEANKHNAIFFLFDPLLSSDTSIKDSLSADCKKAQSNQPKTTLIIDLSKEDGEILADMKEKGRYNIRLAEKKGVIIRPGTVNELYPLLSETSLRDGFQIHPQMVYQTMTDVFKSNALVLVADYEGTIISGGIFLFWGNTGVYYYGASSNAYRNLMAPYLVQWKAIQEAKKKGCQQYDFLGIADDGAKNHPWAGVTEFKLKFGGEKRSYIGAHEIVYKPLWTHLYNLRKKV